MDSPINFKPPKELITAEERKRQRDREEWEIKYRPYREYEQLFEPKSEVENENHYQSRIIHLGKRFKKLKGIEQKFIIAAKEDGVFWRGDDMEFFRKVYDEYHRQQGMTVKQRKDYRLKIAGCFIPEIDNEAFNQQKQLYGGQQ